jgi:hypothetical protein
MKKWLFCRLLLVLSPQPAGNQNQTLNQKQVILQLIIEDEVVGQVFLLLKIRIYSFDLLCELC